MADTPKARFKQEQPSSREEDADPRHVQWKRVSIQSLTRDTIGGYIFWSLFQSHLPAIWYFPQDSLGISGYEVIGFLIFLPLLCGIPVVLSAVQSQRCLGVLRFLTVASVACFHAPTILVRLIVHATGCGVSMIVLTATLFSPSQRIRCQTYWSLLLGLFAFLSSRVWFVSYIPTWWNKESNSVVLALGIAATAHHIFSGADKRDTEFKELPASDKKTNWVMAGAGLGSLLFLTHWCFGEVSVITRWVVSSYPDSGPQPGIWGAPVLVCLLLGVFLSQYEMVTRHILWHLVGGAAFYALYYLPTWQGYAGGLALGVFTMSVWSAVVNQASACPPVRTLVLALFVYILEIVFEIWTVAYNFVPGGEFTRERTDVLIAIVMILIFVGIHSGGWIPKDFTAFAGVCETNMPTMLHQFFLVLLVLTGLLGFGIRYNPQRHTPPQKTHPDEFTAAIWACRFSYDNAGWYSFSKAATVLNDTGADVIVIIESDASKPFLGNNDLAMWMGEKLGMHADFGPATRDHTWGMMLLSKFPIIKSAHHHLPSPHGELAPAITATINMSGRALDFVVGHNGNDGDDTDRELQTKYLAEQLQKCQNPAVYMGYVTSKPKTRDYWQLVNTGSMKDIDDTDMKRWCLYIMYKKLIRLGYARISNGGLSDTEVQVARFRIPHNLADYDDNEIVSTDPTEVDSHIHFNPVFGEFYRGHGYFMHNSFHMDTPKYFLPECVSNITRENVAV